MKLEKIIEALELNYTADYIGNDRQVTGVYCCDLLSWVMARGEKGNVWITVQIHPNIVAVASLLEFSCIIIPENIEIEKITLEKAINENIPILTTEMTAYEICRRLSELGI